MFVTDIKNSLTGKWPRLTVKKGKIICEKFYRIDHWSSLKKYLAIFWLIKAHPPYVTFGNIVPYRHPPCDMTIFLLQKTCMLFKVKFLVLIVTWHFNWSLPSPMRHLVTLSRTPSPRVSRIIWITPKLYFGDSSVLLLTISLLRYK